jgi:hypothetical protein
VQDVSTAPDGKRTIHEAFNIHMRDSAGARFITQTEKYDRQMLDGLDQTPRLAQRGKRLGCLVGLGIQHLEPAETHTEITID